MCRNIRLLFNFKPPATQDEIEAAALQFVRKISGFNRPSAANQAAFQKAVEAVASSSRELLATLTTQGAPRDRSVEAAKAKERNRRRFGTASS